MDGLGGEGDGSDLEEGKCAEEGKEVIVADEMRIVRGEFWAVCWKMGSEVNGKPVQGRGGTKRGGGGEFGIRVEEPVRKAQKNGRKRPFSALNSSDFILRARFSWLILSLYEQGVPIFFAHFWISLAQFVGKLAHKVTK